MGSSLVLPAVSERERALLATAEIWGEAGWEGLSATAICARAGIEPESLTAMFPDLEAIAVATIEVPLGAVVSVVAELYAPDRSEAESCVMAIVAILELMAANPAYADVAYIAGRQMAPSGVHSVYKSGHQFLVAMLERLWEGSRLKQQPARTALGALGAAEAVVRREIVDGNHERLPSLAPAFVYAATVPFLGQREGLRLAQLARELVGEGEDR
jgi:AcrR family transcriptional regulator